MANHRPVEFVSVIGGESGWKDTFKRCINLPKEEWPESMLFWAVQLGNTTPNNNGRL